MKALSLPSVAEVRTRIESIPSTSIRLCLEAAYLLGAARISEICGQANWKEKAYGPKGTDARLDRYGRHKVAVFAMKTAKRQGKPRPIALPLEPQYEPWSQQLYDYFKQAKTDCVFPFTRKVPWRYVTKARTFEGLTYPIERYTVWKNGQLAKTVDRHTRPFKLHALRHLRASELVDFYGFDGFNLATYGGWTIKSALGTTGIFDRYVSLGWSSYFPKLLKKR